MTPAHDPNDYEVGMRHKLEFINILNDDGTLNSNAGPEFEGMKRFHARKKVIEEMKKKGLYEGDADNPMQIPVCAKSGDVIESVMKPQWWVSCKTLADKAIEVSSILISLDSLTLPELILEGLESTIYSELVLENSRFDRQLQKVIGIDGSREFKIGVSLVNSGGDTELLLTSSRSKVSINKM